MGEGENIIKIEIMNILMSQSSSNMTTNTTRVAT
jgi:hypothetical protein